MFSLTLTYYLQSQQLKQGITLAPSAHYASGFGGFMQSLVFFFNMYFFLNGDLYIDASITEFFQICLVVSQTLRGGTLQNVFTGVLRERWVSQFSLVGASEDCLKIRFLGLVVVIIWGGNARHKGGGEQFSWGRRLLTI